MVNNISLITQIFAVIGGKNLIYTLVKPPQIILKLDHCAQGLLILFSSSFFEESIVTVALDDFTGHDFS